MSEPADYSGKTMSTTSANVKGLQTPKALKVKPKAATTKLKKTKGY